MNPLSPTITWLPLDSLARLTLGLLVGLFIGLEREWRGKDAGLRTFGLVSMLGAMGAMIAVPYALTTLALVGVLIVFLNVQSIRAGQGSELTTSAALLVTALAGILCGLGHTITPVAVAVVTTGLLSWKERLADFGHRLTAEELRAAVLLGVLAFAVYPVLPDHPIDPWRIIAPRPAWVTVILIAAMGFVNYVLSKIFGARGVEIAGFFGGLVNSTVIATELSSRVKETGDALVPIAYRGALLSVAAMAVRNAVILAFFAPHAFAVGAGSLGLILVASLTLASLARRMTAQGSDQVAFELSSPFSLRSALKFGLVFLLLQVLGSLAQGFFGRFGFYAVSVAGGLVSSASAVASAAMLAKGGHIPVVVAGVGAVLASLASVSVNLVIVRRVAGSRLLERKLGTATLLIVLLGLAGAVATALFLHEG